MSGSKLKVRSGVAKMEDDGLEQHLSELSKVQLIVAAASSIRMMGRLINRVISLCKFMEMPDDVIQEVLMMCNDQEMFDITMRDYNKLVEDDDDPFVIIDMTRANKGGKNDKSRNVSKNDSWNRSR